MVSLVIMMILQTMINREIKNRKNKAIVTGFTFLELMVVLAIISTMVAVIMPFCKRSNNSVEIRQAGSSIAQTIRYAIDLAEKRKKAIKFIFNGKFKSYYLEMEDDYNNFKPTNDFTGTSHFIGREITLFDIQGFEQSGQEYSIIFDPQRSWPNANMTISNNESFVTIEIRSKHVQMQEKNI